MKILFIYTKADNALREKAEKLREHKAEVSMLSLLEYKLDNGTKSHTFDIDSKLEFLEKNHKLRVLNRVYKRKKLISYLDYYEIIILYKCEKSSLFIVDDLSDKCYDFFILSDGNELEKGLIKKQLYSNLYKKARFIIFNSQSKKSNFDKKFEDKTRVIYDAISQLKEIDKISQEDIFKASHAMELDLDKDIVYVDLNSSMNKQLKMIQELGDLNIEKLKKTTFIFHLSAHDLDQRNNIKDALKDKNFDYLLIETMMNDKQKALIFKLTNKSIILSNNSSNLSLPLSLYSKNYVYLYEDVKLDSIFIKEKFFMKSYEDFKKENLEEKDSIQEDLLSKNKDLIYDIFDPEKSIQRCIEVIKEV